MHLAAGTSPLMKLDLIRVVASLLLALVILIKQP
jgi:hypothetical protein